MSNSFKRALLLVMITAACIGASTYKPSAKEAYETIVSKLEVRETGGLMFARYNAENLKILDAFLEQYESGLEHEKVLYLRAHTIWSLHQYEKAPVAYADYIKQYPEGRFAGIGVQMEAPDRLIDLRWCLLRGIKHDEKLLFKAEINIPNSV